MLWKNSYHARISVVSFTDHWTVCDYFYFDPVSIHFDRVVSSIPHITVPGTVHTGITLYRYRYYTITSVVDRNQNPNILAGSEIRIRIRNKVRIWIRIQTLL
jgi:hypothetical protein